MSEISFYHLTRQPLNKALPRLLEKVLAAGHRALVLAGSEERVEDLDAALWTYDAQSFLPHGSRALGHAERQPIFLTTAEENPNEADILVLVDGADPAFVGDFTRCLDMFDGNDDAAVEAARERWKRWKAAGHELTYWQQTEGGGWTRKA